MNAIDLIIRDVCAIDPAEVDAENTVCIGVDDLRVILETRLTPVASPAPTQCADRIARLEEANKLLHEQVDSARAEIGVLRRRGADDARSVEGFPATRGGEALRVQQHRTIEAHRGIVPAVPDVAIDQGWTGNTDIDAALLMLDRMDVSSDDDARVDAISATLRKLAAQLADVASVPDALSGNPHAGGTKPYPATGHHNERGSECGGMMLESVLAANTQGAKAQLSAPMWTVAGKGLWVREQIDEYVHALLAQPDALVRRKQVVEECADSIAPLYKQPEPGRRKVSTGYDEGHNDALDEAQQTHARFRTRSR